MQKVHFINGQNQKVTFTPYEPPFVLESIKGVDAAGTNLILQHPAGMHGALYEGLLLDDREITVTVHIIAQSRRSLYSLKQSLIRQLGSAEYSRGKLGVLWYENDHGRWWTPAVVKQGPRQVGVRKQNWITVQFVFYAPSPDWRAASPSINRMAFLSGGFKFPLSIPAVSAQQPGIKFGSSGYRLSVFSAGDTDSPICIEITGPSVKPCIRSLRTGQVLTVGRSLASGDTLTICTETGKKSAVITRATGQKEDAMGYVDPASSWIVLAPGDNLLEYTSGDDTTRAKVIITSYARFGGV